MCAFVHAGMQGPGPLDAWPLSPPGQLARLCRKAFEDLGESPTHACMHACTCQYRCQQIQEVGCSVYEMHVTVCNCSTVCSLCGVLHWFSHLQANTMTRSEAFYTPMHVGQPLSRSHAHWNIRLRLRLHACRLVEDPWCLCRVPGVSNHAACYIALVYILHGK